MLLPNFNLIPFFSPDENGNRSVESKELGVQGMISLMEEDDTKESIKLIDDREPIKEEPIKLIEEEEKEETEDDDEEVDEIKELEDELKEPDEDKLELITPARRKDILKEYPEVFKKFPYLEHAYYRDQQFSEMFATPKEAKSIIEKAQVLDLFDNDLKEGNIQTTLKAVKDVGETAFNKLVDDYLPNLAKIDKDAYHHVIGNIIRTTAIQMIEDGKNSGNDDLLDAAKIMYKFIFPGDKQIMRPSQLSRGQEENKEADKIKQQQNDFLQQRFETARDELTTRVTNTLKSTIEANIDPRSSMTDYVKKNASRDCYEKLENLLNSDKRLGVLIDRLWEGAFRENFSKSSMDKIKTAYNSRAKSLLPTVIKQARQEALKSGKRDDTTDRKGPIPVGKSASSSHNSGKSTEQRAKEIPAEVSSRDYLMQD